MQFYIYQVNEKGMQEIHDFLKKYHLSFINSDITSHTLMLWAECAEAQLDQGNPPCVEIHAFYSVTGHAIEFRISDEGYDKILESDEIDG